MTENRRVKNMEMTRGYDRDKQKKVGLSWVRKNIIITTPEPPSLRYGLIHFFTALTQCSPLLLLVAERV